MSVLTEKYWNIKKGDPALQAVISKEAKVHPIVAQLLINRGIVTALEAKAFLSSELSQLHDPLRLKDMDVAVKRIREAKENNEPVMVYGDYDVDGVTSSAVLYHAFKKMGINIINHIPHRMRDGYGLNERIGQYAKDLGVKLIITVDCGITALKEVEALKKFDIECIILDHHEPSEEGLPDALAVIDPKREDCSYPFKYLAAVGLSGKLIQALCPEHFEDVLDLIALGTIVDVVPLRGENRIIVKCGIPMINQTKNPGLLALMEVANIKGKNFQPYYAGFVLGPRLNASGRMDSAHRSLDLLIAESYEEALSHAQFLDDMNSERQKMQKTVVKEAMDLVEKDMALDEQKVIVVSKEGWHKGVLGIVASKLADTYYRPSIVISLNEGVGTASARSIKGFHLDEALTFCTDILEAHGGHKQAAGLTIREEKIAFFREKINQFAKNIIEMRNLIPTIDIDCEIPLYSLGFELLEQINQLEPYGEGNPDPVFCSRGLKVKSQPVALGKNTLKLWLTDGQYTISAVGFGMGELAPHLPVGKRVDVAYQLIVDDWNKSPTIQLKLKDIKISHS